MAEIARLKAELAKPGYAGKTPEQIVEALKAPVPIPDPPPPPSTQTLGESLGFGVVTIQDVLKAQGKGPPAMRSPEGTPGSWRVEPAAEKFAVIWDEKPSPLGEFDTPEAAKAAMLQWFDDHPPVPA